MGHNALAMLLSELEGGTCHSEVAEGRLLSDHVVTEGGVAQNGAGVRSMRGASSLGVSGSTS